MAMGSEIDKIIDLLGPDRQSIWLLLRDSANLSDGFFKRQDGWYLKTAKTILFFNETPFPGLAGYADIENNRIWADARYQWRFEYANGDGIDPKRSTKIYCPDKTELYCNDLGCGDWEVVIKGSTEDISVLIVYKLLSNGGNLEERISITNESGKQLSYIDWDFGLSRGLTCYGWFLPVQDLDGFHAAAVPWRKEMYAPMTLQDFTLKDILERAGGQNPFIKEYSHMLPFGGLTSEAWALINDKVGLLVTKYAPKHLEYCVLRHEPRECLPDMSGGQDHEVREERHEHLIFGGSVRCHGDPSPGLINPGATYEMGLTRYQVFSGEWEIAFELFKNNMNEWGCGLREDYNSFVHWNELYDNKTEWMKSGAELEESKYKHYRIEDMKEEASKAVEYSCETLYMDPGWDTLFANSVWDEKRLGDLKSFVAMIKREYGLHVALHTPLAAWCDPEGFPEISYRMDRTGLRHKTVCAGSTQYLETKAERLRALTRDGVSFLMFDGSFHTGSCYDPNHGHPIPYSRDDHIKAYSWLAKQVHEINPDLIIEMHDLATVFPDMPVYLCRENGWDDIWGWEMMWDSYTDLVASGRAITLYYYNLAYTIPVYLHIDLRKDNDNGLMFWWYASLCRHLGIGGTHENPVTQELLKQSMRIYMDYKKFFVRGNFIGLGETAHLHTLNDYQGGVLLLFNLEANEKNVTVNIPLAKLNINSGISVESNELICGQSTDAIELCVNIKPFAPTIIQVAVNDMGNIRVNKLVPIDK